MSPGHRRLAVACLHPMRRTLMRLLGYTMMTFAGFGFLGLFNKPPASPVGAGIILGMLALGGLGLAWPRRVAPATPVLASGVTVEQAVLQAARTLHGRMTVAEVAAESGLSMADVDTALTRMETDNVCTSLVGESGIVVYLFSEFEDPDAKRQIFAGDEDLRRRALSRNAQKTQT